MPILPQPMVVCINCQHYSNLYELLALPFHWSSTKSQGPEIRLSTRSISRLSLQNDIDNLSSCASSGLHPCTPAPYFLKHSLTSTPLRIALKTIYTVSSQNESDHVSSNSHQSHVLNVWMPGAVSFCLKCFTLKMPSVIFQSLEILDTPKMRLMM